MSHLPIATIQLLVFLWIKRYLNCKPGTGVVLGMCLKAFSTKPVGHIVSIRLLYSAGLQCAGATQRLSIIAPVLALVLALVLVPVLAVSRMIPVRVAK